MVFFYENPAHNERHNCPELFTQRYLGGRLNKAKAPVHYGFLSVFGVLVLVGQALCCLPQALSVQHKRSMIQNTNVPLPKGKAVGKACFKNVFPVLLMMKSRKGRKGELLIRCIRRY